MTGSKYDWGDGMGFVSDGHGVRSWRKLIVVLAAVASITVALTVLGPSGAGVAAQRSTPARSGSARQASAPRLFTDWTLRNGSPLNWFTIRPRRIPLSSNYGGMLKLHWGSWGEASATATGTASPDHGVYRVRVRASHLWNGIFLHLDVRIRFRGRWQLEKLLLADSPDLETYGWLDQQAINEPGSGVVQVGK
jgi:hypothetical protein